VGVAVEYCFQISDVWGVEEMRHFEGKSDPTNIRIPTSSNQLNLHSLQNHNIILMLKGVASQGAFLYPLITTYHPPTTSKRKL
jgi:hypothetical protein